MIILTNLSATEEQLVNDVVTHKPMHYLIKSDWKLHDVIGKIEDQRAPSKPTQLTVSTYKYLGRNTYYTPYEQEKDR